MFSFFSGPKKPLSSKPPAAAGTPAVGTPAAGTPAVGTPAAGTPAVSGARNATGEARLMKGLLGDRAAQLPKGNMGSNMANFVKQTNFVGMKGVGAEKRMVVGNTRNVRNWAASRKAAQAAAPASSAAAAHASSAAAAPAAAPATAPAAASTNAAKGGYRKTRRNGKTGKTRRVQKRNRNNRR